MGAFKSQNQPLNLMAYKAIVSNNNSASSWAMSYKGVVSIRRSIAELYAGQSRNRAPDRALASN